MSLSVDANFMNDENWKEEFKEWKPELKPFQKKLLEDGAQSQSQALLLNDMWCEWKEIAVKRKVKEIASKKLSIKDPWKDNEQEISAPYG